MSDTTRPRHHWVCGGLRRDRERAVAALGLPPALLPAADCHRRRRGPYTGAGAVARALTPDALARDPELVGRYDIELLSVAPELSEVVPSSRETLTSMAIPTERTRFYARLRTRRIASGLVEFVAGALPPGPPRTLILEGLDEADLTDVEFAAAALRRIDPAVLTIVICSAAELPDPALAQALATRADRTDVTAGPARSDPEPDPGRAYIWSDGASDEPALLAAYEALDPARRARWHDERAAELAARDELSLRLGAIPYHLARGADPAGAGLAALFFAQDHCVCLGFYTIGAELGAEALELADPRAEAARWWRIAVELGLSLSLLSRTDEALDLYDRARLLSIDPTVHMAAAYSTAMLYTRHNDPAERDEKKAKAWLNGAIATAGLVENPSERAFQSAFYRNGLALVEVNLGEPSEALRLVNECIDMLDRLLTPDEHKLHRSVLKNNRARVYSGLGRLDEALADYAFVIRDDPNHAEHYLERGNILRKLGRHDEALADYATALRLSPPFPEIYYNRADLRLATGDRDGALADFSYVIELEPEFAEAWASRASLRLEDGDLDGAAQDVAQGLRRDPDSGYLHALSAQVALARGDAAAAVAACDRAIAADARLAEAWACRGEALFEAGDPDGAEASLSRALELGEDAALLYNRATARLAIGQAAGAITDLERAAELQPDDEDVTELLDQARGELAGSAS